MLAGMRLAVPDGQCAALRLILPALLGCAKVLPLKGAARIRCAGSSAAVFACAGHRAPRSRRGHFPAWAAHLLPRPRATAAQPHARPVRARRWGGAELDHELMHAALLAAGFWPDQKGVYVKQQDS